MTKLLKIVNSPFTSSVEVVGELTMKSHVPYSTESVTMQFSPNYVEYRENADNAQAKIRQIAITTSTDQTSTFAFDFNANRKHTIKSENHSYTIELMAIGKERIQGHDFPCFEFAVVEA